MIAAGYCMYGSAIDVSSNGGGRCVVEVGVDAAVVVATAVGVFGGVFCGSESDRSTPLFVDSWW